VILATRTILPELRDFARISQNLAFWRAGAGAGASSDPVDHIPACGCENPVS
jgi:hypothetical protein